MKKISWSKYNLYRYKFLIAIIFLVRLVPLAMATGCISGVERITQPTGPMQLHSPGVFRVLLHSREIPDSASMKPGIGNLFFNSEYNKTALQVPRKWVNVEMAPLILNNKFVEDVFIARCKNKNGNYEYYPDSNADGNFRNEQKLVFKEGGRAYTIANMRVALKQKNKTGGRLLLDFQLLIPVNAGEKEKYVYALQKKYYTGLLKTGDVSIRVEFYRSFKSPFFEPANRSFTLYMDANADGSIYKGPSLITPGEQYLKSELVADPMALVKIGNNSFSLKAIDPNGRWVDFERNNQVFGVEEGFIVPVENRLYKGFPGNDTTINIIPAPGSLSLVILSAVGCAPCERIRPALNRLDDIYKLKGLNSYIMLRDSSLAQVNGYFEKHLYNARKLATHEENWNVLNRKSFVPVFYIINSEGMVIFKGIGAPPEQEQLLEWVVRNNLKVN